MFSTADALKIISKELMEEKNYFEEEAYLYLSDDTCNLNHHTLRLCLFFTTYQNVHNRLLWFLWKKAVYFALVEQCYSFSLDR